jgi:high affinity Mn2+ porin
MNWSIMYNGAWDYPAHVRGYTAGVLQELTMRRWSVRAAVVRLSTTASGPVLDTRVTKNRVLAGEGKFRFTARRHPGKFRILGFLNRDDGETFREAPIIDDKPDLESTRRMGTPQ